MRKVIVFGASGMLGGYIEAYFSGQGAEIVAASRGDVLVEPSALRRRLAELSREPTLVINCVGVIKPQVAVQGVAETIRVNALFPHTLAAAAAELGHTLIHITTDCVFSGREGSYHEGSPHDETDAYGRTKSLGEPESCLVIRTSIIGEERINKRSLIEWAKSQAGKEVRGFTNHTWNGVTCLQLAKCIHQLLESGVRWSGVRHIFSPRSVNKLELLNLIDGAFGLKLLVSSFETPTPCYRTLSTRYPEILGVCAIPDLREQLAELREFKLR